MAVGINYDLICLSNFLFEYFVCHHCWDSYTLYSRYLYVPKRSFCFIKKTF